MELKHFPTEGDTAWVEGAAKEPLAHSEQARVSAINALNDRGYGDLKHASDADEIPGLRVRFVNPSDKP